MKLHTSCSLLEEQDQNPQDQDPQDQDQKSFEVNLKRTDRIVSYSKGKSCEIIVDRKSFDSNENLVYGVIVDLEGNPPQPPMNSDPDQDDQKKISVPESSQTIINHTNTSQKVNYATQMIERITQMPSSQTKVLTYFSENQIEGTFLQDYNQDQIVDPIESTGQWIGIARLYLTPYVLGYDRLIKMNQKASISNKSPLIVRLVSFTISLKTVTIESPELETLGTFLGPTLDIPLDLGVGIAYIPSQTIQNLGQYDDLIDSISVKQLTQTNSEGKAWYFCGVGLTTRTKQGYDANGEKPLYENGMQMINGTYSQEKGIICCIPQSTTTIYVANNTVVLEDEEEETTFTISNLVDYQKNQAQAQSKIGLNAIPLWGAIQVQVSRQIMNGLILDTLYQNQNQTDFNSITRFKSAILNCNLVFAVSLGAQEDEAN